MVKKSQLILKKSHLICKHNSKRLECLIKRPYPSELVKYLGVKIDENLN